MSVVTIVADYRKIVAESSTWRQSIINFEHWFVADYSGNSIIHRNGFSFYVSKGLNSIILVTMTDTCTFRWTILWRAVRTRCAITIAKLTFAFRGTAFEFCTPRRAPHVLDRQFVILVPCNGERTRVSWCGKNLVSRSLNNRFYNRSCIADSIR